MLGRYLAMGGKIGSMPDWYLPVLAADRLHCRPWELLEQSIYWQDVAMKARAAEVWAQKILDAHKG